MMDPFVNVNLYSPNYYGFLPTLSTKDLLVKEHPTYIHKFKLHTFALTLKACSLMMNQFVNGQLYLSKHYALLSTV